MKSHDTYPIINYNDFHESLMESKGYLHGMLQKWIHSESSTVSQHGRHALPASKQYLFLNTPLNTRFVSGSWRSSQSSGEFSNSHWWHFVP